AGKLFSEFLQVLGSKRILFLAAGREGQQDLGKRLQVVAVLGGFLHLGHAQSFVSVDAAEPENKSRGTRKRADDVISDAGSNVHVIGVGMVGQENFSAGIGFLQVLQRVVMFFQQHAVGVGLHASRKGESVETFRVVLVLLQTLSGQGSGLGCCVLKTLHPFGIRNSRDAAEKALVIQEVIAGEDLLVVKLFKKVAGRDGNLAERLGGILLRPLDE